MIKLLVISPSGFGLDGITSYIINMYNEFDSKEMQMTLIITKILGDKNKAIMLLERVKKMGINVVELPRSGKHLISYCMNFMKFLRQENFNIIHVHGSSSMISLELQMAAWCGVSKRIAHSHNTQSNHPKLHRFLKRRLNKIATDKVACGVLAGNWMFGKEEFKVLINGIDVNKFKYSKEIRIKTRQQLGISDDSLLLGHVGGFNMQKNQEFLIRFFERYSILNNNAQLILIGSGYNLENIKKLAKSMSNGDRIHFLGQRTDISDLMNAMDIFLLPSNYEGLPIVAVEAQASGLSVIMSDRITSEVALTENTYYCSLDEGIEPWINIVNKISVNEYERMLCSKVVKNKGYGIKEAADTLKRLYFN